MSDYIFPKFFNEERSLKKSVLKSLDLKSKIGIESFSCEELKFIYEKFDLENTLVSVHHAEWGKAEEIREVYNFDAVCGLISEIFYEDKIFFFPEVNLYVWEPSENKFYVLFGSNNIIRQADFSFLEKDYYMEILNEDTGLSEQGRQYMLNALEKYGGFND